MCACNWTSKIFCLRLTNSLGTHIKARPKFETVWVNTQRFLREIIISILFVECRIIQQKKCYYTKKKLNKNQHTVFSVVYIWIRHKITVTDSSRSGAHEYICHTLQNTVQFCNPDQIKLGHSQGWFVWISNFHQYFNQMAGFIWIFAFEIVVYHDSQVHHSIIISLRGFHFA